MPTPPIHWFPGHMATARDEIRRAMPQVDLVIEVLDARIPFSSENPLVAQLRGATPALRVLNKADLADPAATAAWLEALGRGAGVRAISHSQGEKGLLQRVLGAAALLVPAVRARALAAMIVGIPNVGKSTLINTLAGRAITRTANKPAITQMQQRVQVSPQLVLFDTPGFLWPKLSPAVCGLRLGVTGAISDRAVDAVALASFAAGFLLTDHAPAVCALYGLAAPPDGDVALLEAVARKRGFVVKGGGVDLRRAADRLLVDFRTGAFGRISLEHPEPA